MTVAEKRKILVSFLKKGADEKLVNMIYAVAEEYQKNTEVVYELTPAQIKKLDKDRKAYLAGKGKTYTMEEVDKLIKRKLMNSKKNNN